MSSFISVIFNPLIILAAGDEDYHASMASRQNRTATTVTGGSNQRSHWWPRSHQQQMYFHQLAQQAWEQANMQPFYLHGGELYQVDANGTAGGQYTYRPHGQGEQGAIYNNFLPYEYGDQSHFNAPNEFVLHEYAVNALNQPEDQGYPQSPRDEFFSGAETTSTGESPTSAGDQVTPVSAEEGGLDTEPGPYERYVWQRLQDVYYGPVVTNYGTCPSC